GVEHFNFELGGRYSDWSMPGVDKVGSYKALIDWGVTPKYRLRGGFNRALRAPNLGELFIARTQIFGGVAAQFQDQCSQNNPSAPYSPFAGHDPAQVAQTLSICRTLMGPLGAAQYYDNRPLSQQPTGTGPFGGGNGIQNSFGNPDLHEEQADTFTLGVVMDFLQNWTLSVDYYQIEIKDMIAVESPDTTYEGCLSIAKNPTGDPNAPACQRIFRNPTDGTPANIDLTYTNLGRAKVEGVDLQLNWTKSLGDGSLNLNSVMNYNISSETQDNPTATTREWAGTQGCGLQIQCQGYDYRIFTTVSYFRGPWGVSLRHQYWPSIDPSACAEPVVATPTNPDPCGRALATGGGVQESYQLFALSGSYRFGDKYTLRVGIENLLDKLPPVTGANPFVSGDGTGNSSTPYPVAGTHSGNGLGAGAGATYDPLGRRGFVSLTMDF
ncbi:MAG TPA: TonB-dependent receptor, partial [Gammaproteobacteria bacterium]|nr:TonB-dependent receptor [Gammaproteobacteria bacterium]